MCLCLSTVAVCREVWTQSQLLRLNEDEQQEFCSQPCCRLLCSKQMWSQPQTCLHCIFHLACKVMNLSLSRTIPEELALIHLQKTLCERFLIPISFLVLIQITFCVLNGLHQCTAWGVSKLNSTAAKHVMPLIAESNTSCKDCTFPREPVWWDVSTSYAINRPDEYHFQSQRNTFLISWGM